MAEDPYFHVYQRVSGCEKNKQRRILMTIPYGIGDVVYLGLSAVDQILKNDPSADIDVLCNEMQREMFMYDPRICRVIVAERTFFPTPDNFTLRKALSIDRRALGLLRFLRGQAYEAVVPGNVAFRFVHALGTRVMYPDIISVARDYWIIQNFGDAPARKRMRSLINRYFENPSPPDEDDSLMLYVDPAYIPRARSEISLVKERAPHAGQKPYVIVIAPDTTSSITRPPTPVIVEGLIPVLDMHSEAIVYILPSYSDTEASRRIYNQMSLRYGARIQYMPEKPRPSLMFCAMVADHADMLITGDTGIMHLAVATKVVKGGASESPRNAVAIIAIFGGTNPGLYGYHMRTIIIGRGHQAQCKIRPGFIKEGYDPKGRDYFNHITPADLTQAVWASME